MRKSKSKKQKRWTNSTSTPVLSSTSDITQHAIITAATLQNQPNPKPKRLAKTDQVRPDSERASYAYIAAKPQARIVLSRD